MGASLWKQWLDHQSVDFRASIQETGANVATIFSSQSKEKRDRYQNVVHSLRDRKISRKSLNGKLTRPSEEREWLNKKLYEAQHEVEARNWEKRNSDTAFS